MSTTQRPVEILLVEDNPGDVVLTEHALQGTRIQNRLTVAQDGAAAMRLLESAGEAGEVPDLVLLDLNLPKVGGKEVLAWIRANPATADVPVVVLTSSSADQDIIESYGLKASAYVTKPVNLDQFLEAISSIEQFWLVVARLLPR